MKKYSIITIALFLCLSMFFHTSAIAIETLVPDTVYWEDKIDESVYESPIYENGKRLIYIERESIPKELVAKNLKQKYNYSMDVYENEEEYEKQIVPAVTARVVAELGETAAYSTAEQLQLTGESISPVDRALSDDYNEYISAKRSVTKELYTASTDSFLESKVDNPEDVLYQGSYSSTFILYATKSEIEKYAKSTEVIRILPFENKKAIPESVPIEQSQIGVDSISGTKSSLFNSGVGYKGTGIKVGIIEAGGRYDDEAPQLRNIHNTSLSYLNSETTSSNVIDHATRVTSLIVGQPYEENGITYEGVVPQATVHMVRADNTLAVFFAMIDLHELGVSVINCSLGLATSPSYDPTIDGELDKLIDMTGITFVKSAGNIDVDNPNGYVTSPGKAFNAIVVGNATTKVDDYLPANSPFNANESAYIESSIVGNRPDVVAPGTNIKIPGLLSATGSSFAAPLVAGIAVQLHQANPLLKTNPVATKAIIMAGANPSIISTTDNPLVSNVRLRDKTGAGMVDAVTSMNILLNEQYISQEYTINTLENTLLLMERVTPIFVPEGEQVRIILTFERCYPYSSEDLSFPATYGNDLDISIHNYNSGSTLAYSNSATNHVEVIEYTSQQNEVVYVNISIQNLFEYTPAYVLKYTIAWEYF